MPAASAYPTPMIEGTVTGNQQALVTIEVIGGNDSSLSLDAMVDTGFGGYLTLPADAIRQLGLRPVGRRTFELANGELFDFEAYLGAVRWHGQPTESLVLKSNGVPLLGMTLLWGSRIVVDVLTDGKVTIEDLTL